MSVCVACHLYASTAIQLAAGSAANRSRAATFKAVSGRKGHVLLDVARHGSATISSCLGAAVGGGSFLTTATCWSHGSKGCTRLSVTLRACQQGGPGVVCITM